MKMAKEASLKKNNSKNAYLLVKDLATEKQGKSTTIQVREVSHRGA